ncbi:deoxyribonuclease IV [Alkalithermobacter paradoxus]|uniref:Probable endonuclease 4 n=1 Tax=Alkalithermobacter paradoxus TaxID=29349 RepID=A0A1V4I7F2_9FIRM|nr:putative endonuclease 4 [[Clostridium] thermoalcaliphilum]
MIFIGPHISISKGFTHAAKEALSIGANTFQFFTRNPRGGSVKELDEKDNHTFQGIRSENKFGPLLAHLPYTVNLGGNKDDVYEFGKRILKEDIKRADQLNIEYICFHPGSHIGSGIEYGIDRISSAINEVLTGNERVMLLLETMSGKGTEIGYTFEQIKKIIDKVNYSANIGVCFDTCHTFAAGYDIVNKLDCVLKEFDDVIGIEKLKVVHFNDSMKEFNSKKDRHEIIGKGLIGLEALVNFMNHPLIKGKPLFLETPGDGDIHREEIKILRNRAL